MQENKAFVIRVQRQRKPNEPPRLEEFELRWRPHINVIIRLRDIAENPVTRDGKKTTPIAYDSNCLEQACGSCAMLINRKALMACSTLMDSLNQPIQLEPLTKFQVVRDLIVNRSIMFGYLKRMRTLGSAQISSRADTFVAPRNACRINTSGRLPDTARPATQGAWS